MLELWGNTQTYSKFFLVEGVHQIMMVSILRMDLQRLVIAANWHLEVSYIVRVAGGLLIHSP